ncbi:hypothetical protein WJX77_011912 [Trebouxia sp. C0004]
MQSPVPTSDERLARLAEGAKLRGSSLPDSWICEVIPRSSKDVSDVYYYSPEGVKFRSAVDVYRHLGLDVCVAADRTPAQKRKTRTANDDLAVLGKGPDVTKEPIAPADGDLKFVYNTAVTDLPDHLQEVPIKCNGKPGVWRLGDNLVECTDYGCHMCQSRTAQGRCMKRSGPHGFSKHCGMSPEAIWRSAFKVEAAGFEGMSVDAYFKQQGYSLKPPAKRQTLDAPSPSFLIAAQQIPVKTPSSNPPQRAKHGMIPSSRDHKYSTRVSNATEQTLPIGTLPNNDFVTNQATTREVPSPPTVTSTQPPATEQNVVSQVAQALTEAPSSKVIAPSPFTWSPSTLSPFTGLQQTPSMPFESGAKAQQAAHQPDGVMQSELAALISSMRDDHAANIAAEKQARAVEVGALKASAVLARQEYLQALDKIKKLETEVYDLRIGKSAV